MVHVAKVLECVMMMKSKHNLNVKANYGAMFLGSSLATPPPTNTPAPPKKIATKACVTLYW